jgi:hypothetical protein
MAKKTMKKMLTIPGYKGNANQNHTKIPITPPPPNVGKDAGEKGTLVHCWWEYKLVQPLWKTIWRLLKKINIELPYDPAIPLLEIYPKECNTGYSLSACTPMLIAALFTIAMLWKQPRCPTTDKWIKKM